MFCNKCKSVGRRATTSGITWNHRYEPTWQNNWKKEKAQCHWNAFWNTLTEHICNQNVLQTEWRTRLPRYEHINLFLQLIQVVTQWNVALSTLHSVSTQNISNTKLHSNGKYHISHTRAVPIICMKWLISTNKTRKAVLDTQYTQTIKSGLCDFWCVRIAVKEQQLAKLCPSVYLHASAGLRMSGFPWNFTVETTEKNPYFVKIYSNIRHFTWRPKNVPHCWHRNM